MTLQIGKVLIEKRINYRPHMYACQAYTYFSIKMKAMFSQGCVYERCVLSKGVFSVQRYVFSKVCFSKGVLVSKGVFYNTPF